MHEKQQQQQQQELLHRSKSYDSRFNELVENDGKPPPSTTTTTTTTIITTTANSNPTGVKSTSTNYVDMSSRGGGGGGVIDEDEQTKIIVTSFAPMSRLHPSASSAHTIFEPANYTALSTYSNSTQDSSNQKYLSLIFYNLKCLVVIFGFVFFFFSVEKST